MNWYKDEYIKTLEETVYVLLKKYPTDNPFYINDRKVTKVVNGKGEIVWIWDGRKE